MEQKTQPNNIRTDRQTLRDLLGLFLPEGSVWADAARWQRLFSCILVLGVVTHHTQKYKVHPPTPRSKRNLKTSNFRFRRPTAE